MKIKEIFDKAQNSVRFPQPMKWAIQILNGFFEEAENRRLASVTASRDHSYERSNKFRSYRYDITTYQDVDKLEEHSNLCVELIVKTDKGGLETLFLKIQPGIYFQENLENWEKGNAEELWRHVKGYLPKRGDTCINFGEINQIEDKSKVYASMEDFLQKLAQILEAHKLSHDKENHINAEAELREMGRGLFGPPSMS